MKAVVYKRFFVVHEERLKHVFIVDENIWFRRHVKETSKIA